MRGPLLLALTLTLAALAGCMADDAPSDSDGPDLGDSVEAIGPFEVGSEAFAFGATIPERLTCDGANVSPPFRVTNAPAGTQVVAIIAGDPDAPHPDAPMRNVTHWLLWNAPVVAGSVTFTEGSVPDGSVQGANVAGNAAYTGPCPPEVGGTHRYFFVFYALDAPLDLQEGASREQLESAMIGHVLGEAFTMGRYSRQPI